MNVLPVVRCSSTSTEPGAPSEGDAEHVGGVPCSRSAPSRFGVALAWRLGLRLTRTGWTGLVAKLIQMLHVLDAEKLLKGGSRPTMQIYHRPDMANGGASDPRRQF